MRSLSIALRFLLFPILPHPSLNAPTLPVDTEEPCEVNASYSLPCGFADVMGGNHRGHEL